MLHSPLLSLPIAGAMFLAAAPGAYAQNTSSVASAEVEPGKRKVEYRAAFAPENNGRPSAFAHRLHYLHSLNDSVAFKVIGLQTKSGGGDWRFRSVTLEGQWQFKKKDDDGWASAIRIDGRIPTEDNRPGRTRIAWLNSVDLGDHWQMRGNIFVGREIGALASDGFSLVTQSEASYKLPSGIRLGAQLFNNYNTTANFGSFSQQQHQIGPIVKGKLSKRAGFNAGVLFGLSDRSPDADFRAFFNHAF